MKKFKIFIKILNFNKIFECTFIILNFFKKKKVENENEIIII